MLLQSVYALVDLGFVARLGDAAVAGLSISLQVFFIVLAVSQVLGITALANISQAYGAGRIDDARSAFAAFFYAALVLGCVEEGSEGGWQGRWRQGRRARRAAPRTAGQARDLPVSERRAIPRRPV